MRDKIRLALLEKGSLRQKDLYEYIYNKLDSDAAIITVYMTLREMVRSGDVVKIGDEYKYNKRSDNGL